MQVTLFEEQIRAVIAAAHRAPSILNTQPWQWLVHREGRLEIDLVADSARVLRVADPLGRFLVVSCGAALLNARVALRHLAHDPGVRLTPDPEQPRVLARLRPLPAAPPDVQDELLFRAIPERHTNRGPFHPRRLSAGTIGALIEAAAVEGATLTLLEGDDALRVLDIAGKAADEIAADQARATEISGWVREGRVAEGISLAAAGARAAGGAPVTRDFDPLGRLPGREPQVYEPSPTVGVLSTDGDTAVDWLRAGQALERVLLTATAAGVSASFRTEPLEVLIFRWRLRDATTGVGHPQMVMRLGFGEPTDPAGRRPLDEVLHTE